MRRRQFLFSLGAAGLGIGGAVLWPDQGLVNPCFTNGLPEALANHELLQSAWQGLDPAQVWDCHAHLIGVGDSEKNLWVNPDMKSLKHPKQYLQFQLYLNASCLSGPTKVDQSYVNRLFKLSEEFKPHAKIMLLAFDYYHDHDGKIRTETSPFYTSNTYASSIAEQFPERFEWIASIHPYRKDCVRELVDAVQKGARAVKWLPSAMGIDPSSPLCDPFYEALSKYNIPLLTHAGNEMAVRGNDVQHLGNPLLLRRPLEHNVRVIVSHCASLGESVDLDKGKSAVKVENFELFTRMMNEQRYENHLFGEISAVLQINRIGTPIETIIQHTDWSERILNGSDYPLPGVMPLFSVDNFIDRGYITANEAKVISEIRKYNALLFDFVLKRHLKFKGKKLANRVFEARRFFEL